MPEVDFWDFSSHVENPMQRATPFTMSGAAWQIEQHYINCDAAPVGFG